MADIQCPTLQDVLAADECLENLAGLSSVCYVGLKEDLQEEMKLTGCTYSTPKFKAGKGLYKFDLQDEGQQIQGESQGYRKGFAQTYDFTIDSVNKKAVEVARALNNRDVFFIVPDGNDTQIMYDPQRKVKFESGGLKSDTGKAASDARQITGSAKLQPVMYSNTYVEAPTEGGWDSLLASAANKT